MRHDRTVGARCWITRFEAATYRRYRWGANPTLLYVQPARTRPWTVLARPIDPARWHLPAAPLPDALTPTDSSAFEAVAARHRVVALILSCDAWRSALPTGGPHTHPEHVECRAVYCALPDGHLVQLLRDRGTGTTHLTTYTAVDPLPSPLGALRRLAAAIPG